MRNRVGRIHRRAYPLVVATTCNSLVVVRRYDFIVYQVFAPRSRRGTTPPMSSHVGCLHGGPDSCCLHSGQLILDCDHASNWFRPVFAQWQTERGGGVLLTPSSCGCRFPRRACSLVSTTASFSLVFPALAARPAGRCLPGHTYKLSTIVFTSNCIDCALPTRPSSQQWANTFSSCYHKSTCFHPAYAHLTDSRQACP